MLSVTMTEPPKLTAPKAAAPGPGLSRRSRALHGLWLTCSTTPLSAGTPAGAVQRWPALTPFSPNAAVSVSQASASVPAAGATRDALPLNLWIRACERGRNVFRRFAEDLDVANDSSCSCVL